MYFCYRGYVGVNSQTGQAEWRDDVLRDPTLPIMDRNGNIIGSDGFELVRYTADGQTLQPEVHLNPSLYPIYSLTVSSTGLILIVSKSGQVATYDTDGMQISFMWLNGTVERFGGTFIPMAQPVLHGSRAYILTQFRPFNIKPPDLGMQRLYAIDIINDIVPRLEVAWVYNFEREISNQPHSNLMQILSRKSFVENFEVEEEPYPDKNLERPQFKFGRTDIRNYKNLSGSSDANLLNSDPEPVRLIEANPLLLYNADLSTIYVNLPPPDPILPRYSNLWALKDQQDNPDRMFRIFANISKMAMYESRGSSVGIAKRRNEKSGLHFIWAIGADGETVLKLSPFEGTILDSLNISALVKTPAVVTSDLMVTRPYDEGDDVLLMGISVPLQTKTKEFSFLCSNFNVQENTTGLLIALKGDNLLWMIATPNNTEVRGQIVPIPVNSENDKFIVFSGNKQKSYIFAFN